MSRVSVILSHVYISGVDHRMLCCLLYVYRLQVYRHYLNAKMNGSFTQSFFDILSCILLLLRKMHVLTFLLIALVFHIIYCTLYPTSRCVDWNAPFLLIALEVTPNNWVLTLKESRYNSIQLYEKRKRKTQFIIFFFKNILSFQWNSYNFVRNILAYRQLSFHT